MHRLSCEAFGRTAGRKAGTAGVCLQCEVCLRFFSVKSKCRLTINVRLICSMGETLCEIR